MADTGRGDLLAPGDVERVRRRYQDRIAQHGVGFASLNAGDEAKQRARHWAHASALRTPNPRILDIGCGLGHFYAYLIGQQVKCAYTGYDIVPEYIGSCRQRFPEATFDLRNVFHDGIDGMYDSVVISQALNNRYEESDNYSVMECAIQMAFCHSRTSVSIDMLSHYVDYEDPDLFYYRPEQIFRFAKSLTRRVIVRHDYRAFEFCIQLFHEDAPHFVE